MELYENIIPDMGNCGLGTETIYRLGDGRLYSIATGEFVAAAASGAQILDLGGPATNANLRETLEFYNLPVGNVLLSPDEIAARKIAAIDAETSSDILAGFDYEVNGELLHFSYDAFDQQNFADKANACLICRVAGEEASAITWNAYRPLSGDRVELDLAPDEFLALYNDGALRHKDRRLETGEQRKRELLAYMENGNMAMPETLEDESPVFELP